MPQSAAKGQDYCNHLGDIFFIVYTVCRYYQYNFLLLFCTWNLFPERGWEFGLCIHPSLLAITITRAWTCLLGCNHEGELHNDLVSFHFPQTYTTRATGLYTHHSAYNHVDCLHERVTLVYHVSKFLWLICIIEGTFHSQPFQLKIQHWIEICTNGSANGYWNGGKCKLWAVLERSLVV